MIYKLIIKNIKVIKMEGQQIKTVNSLNYFSIPLNVIYGLNSFKIVQSTNNSLLLIYFPFVLYLFNFPLFYIYLFQVCISLASILLMPLLGSSDLMTIFTLQLVSLGSETIMLKLFDWFLYTTKSYIYTNNYIIINMKINEIKRI